MLDSKKSPSKTVLNCSKILQFITISRKNCEQTWEIERPKQGHCYTLKEIIFPRNEKKKKERKENRKEKKYQKSYLS